MNPKFRIWNKRRKQFENNILLDSNGNITYCENTMRKLNHKNYIIQRSTGYLDSNNNELYEGDIVILSYKGITEGNYILKYFEPCLSYVLDASVKKRKYLQDHPVWNIDQKLFASKIKVLGNYLENKELLNLKIK